jgi:uncharacterized membrane protein YsdA (DUF1294 family)
MSFLIVAGLLALPVYAMQRHGLISPWAGVAVVVSGLTYWIYAADKRRAEDGLWRVPEIHLHLLELLGGWPGAFLAQRRLRHKSSKGSYQFVFWLIVLIHQLAAFDSLQNWKWSRSALSGIESISQHRR